LLKKIGRTGQDKSGIGGLFLVLVGFLFLKLLLVVGGYFFELKLMKKSL